MINFRRTRGTGIRAVHAVNFLTRDQNDLEADGSTPSIFWHETKMILRRAVHAVNFLTRNQNDLEAGGSTPSIFWHETKMISRRTVVRRQFSGTKPK
jgi:hypothetical protein